MSFPTDTPQWDVSSSQWHIDFPARGQGHLLFAVRVLAFLAPVEAGCGGTLVLTGSHILVARLAASGVLASGKSPEVRTALMRAHPWLRDLFSGDGKGDRVQRFMVDGTVIDGVPLRVVELTGAPGDAFLMHPWQFHAPSPNCGAVPRLMVSHSAVRRDWAAANYRPQG